MENPFNPSFGKMPSVFLNRDSLTQRIVTELNRVGSPFQTSLLYGQRGSGKTTLMTEVSNLISKDKNWCVCRLSVNRDMLTLTLSNLINSGIIKNEDKITEINVSASMFGFGGGVGVNLER